MLLIWDLDPAGGGRVFGSEEVNVENWKALRRLVGHVADVVDCAWSRDDSMLASVGLDSKIIIWDGFTFGMLRRWPCLTLQSASRRSIRIKGSSRASLGIPWETILPLRWVRI